MVVTTSWEQPQDLVSLITDDIPVLNAPSTHSVYSAITLFGDLEPLVIVRRGSSDLLFETAEAAGMRYELIWSGDEIDPLTNMLVFQCRY